jgi:hypothetical protein
LDAGVAILTPRKSVPEHRTVTARAYEESWLEHLRHHERASAADRDVQARLREFHAGSAPPLVTHLLAADRSAGT